MSISVIISAYINCTKSNISKALHSVFYEQKLKPRQIILVLDGPVQKELFDFVFAFQKKVDCDMLIHQIPESKGFANALNQGLELCKYEYIARMDSDDICLSNRFHDQVEYLSNNPNVDVVGSWISEIDENDNIIRDIVKYPETHEQCRASFMCRSPLAHPATMFKASFFKKSGNYPTKILLAEDALLWHQGFMNGCVFANVQKVCLKFRRASDFYRKRRNVKKSFKLLWYRISSINPSMKYGFRGHICAVLSFAMHFLPSVVKKILYDNR